MFANNAIIFPRSFRYMRRVPTIISYRPPEAEIEEESSIEEVGGANDGGSDSGSACTSSDHYILDRVNEVVNSDGNNNSGGARKKSAVKQVGKILKSKVRWKFSTPLCMIIWYSTIWVISMDGPAIGIHNCERYLALSYSYYSHSYLRYLTAVLLLILPYSRIHIRLLHTNS